jgi:cytochrome c biogenesis protein CcmG/thiol:disulfide interchange protein DsbE
MSLETRPDPTRGAIQGWRRLVLVLSPIAVLLALLAYGFRTNPREIPSPLLGRPAALFSLPLFDGGQFSLKDHRGKVVIVDFWASWCIPCREEAPLLEATWRAYRDRGVILVGVNFQDQEEAARAFIREFDLTFPNGRDVGSRIAVDYGVYGIPELFFVTGDGRIASKHIGLIGRPTLEARIAEALRGVVSRDTGRGEQYQSIR